MQKRIIIFIQNTHTIVLLDLFALKKFIILDGLYVQYHASVEQHLVTSNTNLHKVHHLLLESGGNLNIEHEFFSVDECLHP